MAAIGEVDELADDEPNDEAEPGVAGRLSIRSSEMAMPRKGTNGTAGVRNGRSRSGRSDRRIQTPDAQPEIMLSPAPRGRERAA